MRIQNVLTFSFPLNNIFLFYQYIILQTQCIIFYMHMTLSNITWIIIAFEYVITSTTVRKVFDVIDNASIFSLWKHSAWKRDKKWYEKMIKCRYGNIKDPTGVFFKRGKKTKRENAVSPLVKVHFRKKLSTAMQRMNYNNSCPRGITFFMEYLKILQIASLLSPLFWKRKDVIILFVLCVFQYYFLVTILANGDFCRGGFSGKHDAPFVDNDIIRREQWLSLGKNERKWENRRHWQSAMLSPWRCIYFPRHRSGKLLLSPVSTNVILSQADARDLFPPHAIVQTDRDRIEKR